MMSMSMRSASPILSVASCDSSVLANTGRMVVAQRSL